MPFDKDELEQDYQDDLRTQDAFERRQRQQLAFHPECNDPDHPGCENCENDAGEEFDNE